MGYRPRKTLSWIGALAVAVVIVGAGGASSAMAEDPQSMDTIATQQVEGAVLLETEQIEEYDPWEPYNEEIFEFNHDVFDRYVLKPVATGWDYLPDPVQESLGNAFDNVGMPRRLVNNLLQAKFRGAGNELARFGINTTVGVVGLFDVAKTWGIEKSDEDTGQTLGVWGVGPGPYFILPFLPPLTVRDAFGFIADTAMDPINYFVPLAASFGRRAGDSVNARSQNLELFESVEESTVDLYSAVRNAYLQRRQRAIAE
ncbi:VacJ family lipoprotein [Candidatus Methylomirabilis sp.]|uniref:VacJ family lipoprotein n=1 Tax=Candidatus Methylomirabilis tolerans TaxID=3123416 RepID=A0AAJ1AGT3_9BACT|nr:VacJ family lipoprotein [Candidatus Methylomirabilis sp.]